MLTGFFGGSFNPIHMGHVRLANYLLTEYALSEVMLSLSPQNPLKEADHPGATDADRLKMLELACKQYKGLRAWSGELDMPRPSYTYNVLKKLRNEGVNPVLIIGADNWLNFKRWFNAEEILAQYQIIVYPRPGYQLPGHSSHQNVTFATDAPQTDISSTEIRTNINEYITQLPPAVADYVKKHKLYGYEQTLK